MANRPYLESLLCTTVTPLQLCKPNLCSLLRMSRSVNLRLQVLQTDCLRQLLKKDVCDSGTCAEDAHLQLIAALSLPGCARSCQILGRIFARPSMICHSICQSVSEHVSLLLHALQATDQCETRSVNSSLDRERAGMANCHTLTLASS